MRELIFGKNHGPVKIKPLIKQNAVFTRNPLKSRSTFCACEESPYSPYKPKACRWGLTNGRRGLIFGRALLGRYNCYLVRSETVVANKNICATFHFL